MAIQLVVQLIRQRCTVRQDFESPLYISDQLRLRKEQKSSPDCLGPLPLRRSPEYQALQVISLGQGAGSIEIENQKFRTPSGLADQNEFSGQIFQSAISRKLEPGGGK